MVWLLKPVSGRRSPVSGQQRTTNEQEPWNPGTLELWNPSPSITNQKQSYDEKTNFSYRFAIDL
jgi:hypothetical protein